MTSSKLSLNLFLELFAYILLLTAAFIYAFWRAPNTYFSFLCYQTFGLGSNPDFLKQTAPTSSQWLIYNLPSGLWVLAATLLGKLTGNSHKFLLFFPICLVLLIEFLQFCKITDGIFDWLDAAVSLIGFLLAQKIPLQKVEPSAPNQRSKIAYWLCILAVPLSDVM